MVKGSCLCGQVKYEVTSFAKPGSHCHCGQCRKHHGAAFGTYVAASPGAFTYTAGADLVRDYASSEDYIRSFCTHCGSTLTFRPAVGDRVGVAMGTFDDDPGVEVNRHIFVADKAPWYDITDDLPQRQAYD